MELTHFLDLYPTVFHMASAEALPSIETHGLLTTRDLLRLYAASEQQTTEALRGRRRRTVALRHPVHGTAQVRDQLPLKFLRECLAEGTTEQQFLDLLNDRVYFWPTRTRVETLLGASAYRGADQVVLHVDTRRLIETYGSAVELAPYNVGATFVPTAPKRGLGTYVPVHDYPYDVWRQRRGRANAVVEVTVSRSVPDVMALVTRVEHVRR